MTSTVKKSLVIFLSFSLIFTIFITIAAIFPARAEGMVIVLDPGHGGSDNGTEGKMNGKTYYEKPLNMKVARYLWEYLSAYGGVKVYMTRYDDDTKITVASRTKMAADLHANLMVSLHMNALDGNTTFNGTEIFVPKGEYRPEIATESSELASIILSKIGELGMRQIGVKTRLLESSGYSDYPNGKIGDYYGIIRNCVNENIPSMIIEHGYLTNQKDLKFLLQDDNLQALAQATANSIAEKYHLTKTGGEKISLQKQEPVTLAQISTTLKVGSGPIQLSASGGSGNGAMRFESNDNTVLQVRGDKLYIIGEGKANITAVKGTDGNYEPMTSENYVRITVTSSGAAPVTPKPDESDATGIVQTAGQTGGNAGSPSGDRTNSPTSTKGSIFSKDNDNFYVMLAIVGGILAALLIVIIIRIIVVHNRRKRKQYRNNRDRRNQRR